MLLSELVMVFLFGEWHISSKNVVFLLHYCQYFLLSMFLIALLLAFTRIVVRIALVWDYEVVQFDPHVLIYLDM